MTWKPGEPIFDLEDLRGELEQAEPQECFDGDGQEKSVFLGTVFTLTPSGKFYMPWACSNVEPCPTCGGCGEVDSPLAGHLPGSSLQALHHKAQEVDWQIRSLAMRFYGAACEGGWPDHVHVALRETESAVAVLKPRITCPTCGGCGSEEANLDELWREQAESELETIGACLQSGEGDPCDLFAVMSVDSEEG